MATLPPARIASVHHVGAAQPGFAGANHSAAQVIAPGDFDRTNPFILLMDDRLSGQGPVGEEHPHAGLETVTFIVRGRYRDVEGEMRPGDVSWMTAGRGIIHSEDSQSSDDLRLLQTWLTMADGERDIAPRVQTLPRDAVPVRREPGVVAHLYSGRSGDLRASTLNSVPATFLDIALEPGARFVQEIAGGQNGFAYVLEGNGSLGEGDRAVAADEIAWLTPDRDDRALSIVAGDGGMRLILFTADRQRHGIVASGPFIADDRSQLQRQAQDYRAGRFTRSSRLRAADAPGG